MANSNLPSSTHQSIGCFFNLLVDYVDLLASGRTDKYLLQAKDAPIGGRATPFHSAPRSLESVPTLKLEAS